MWPMGSLFGWTLLSRDALRRAETQLRDDVDGVRDEIGFLALHQAYADRFFPGTSVLHIRLRYVLFVPWMYERVASLPEARRISASIEKQELELTRRLKEAGETGVIGIRNFPKPTAQPPSMVYWSALGAWRILRPNPSSTFPSRQTVNRTIARKTTRQQLHDDDRQLLIEDEPIFCSIPEPPAAWLDASQRLDFRLVPSEQRFLRSCLISVTRPDSEGLPSLLSRIVEQRVEMTDRLELWSPKVRGAADSADQAALIRARQAASLSAIGRGIYAAMVEEMREEYDKIPTQDIHRTTLDTIIDQHIANALALNVDDIAADAPQIPGGILEVLRSTQIWLRGTSRIVMSLYDTYASAEAARKDRRARLSKTLLGKERRAEWAPDEHPKGVPLHYPWKHVRQLLIDLQEAS